MREFYKLIATFFYVGYAPVASGTVATCVTVPLYLVLCLVSPLWYITITLILFFTGWYSVSALSGFFDEEDPSEVVIDEVVGFLITMCCVPPDWKWILIGIVFNRFFDIVKIFPAAQCEYIKGGLGVMLDDVVSSLYAAACVWIVIWLFV